MIPNAVKKLGMHETIILRSRTKGWDIMRVPGGLIYNTTFVPFEGFTIPDRSTGAGL